MPLASVIYAGLVRLPSELLESGVGLWGGCRGSHNPPAQALESSQVSPHPRTVGTIHDLMAPDEDVLRRAAVSRRLLQVRQGGRGV